MPTHRVAVVQTGSSLFETPRTLDRMAALCEQAKAEGAELIVFPEAYIGGYPKGLDFGTRVGGRSPAGRDDFLRYHRSAIAVPGAETARIGEMAADLGAYLVVGVIERDGGTLYCTALFFGPDGTLLGKHRKLMPTAMERIVWGQGDGSTMPVIDTPVGHLAAAICWENYMPAFRQTLYAKGVTVWCAPTVDDRDVWHASMRHIAAEGRVFVLCACQVMRRGDIAADHAASAEGPAEEVLIRGGSCIVGPLGDVLAGPVYGEEAILTADIDLDDVVRGRFDLDVTGHYARPDLFQLSVDETPHRPVDAFRIEGSTEEAGD